MAKETAPKVILSKAELKALGELETADRVAVASMEVRNAETAENQKRLAEFRKGLKTKDISDSVKRRELRRGKRE